MLPEGLAGERVEARQLVDFVAEQLDPERDVFVRGVDLDDVAADAEDAAVEVVVVALVLNLDELSQNLVAIDPLPALERQHHPVVGLGRSQPVDARDAGHDDDVPALEERPRRREPHPVDLVVDRRFLLDVRVGRRDVGFRLVVVVVADEVLDGVLGKEPAELLIELRGERLVVGHDEGRTIHLRDALRHGERLARPGHAEQDLRLVAAVQPRDELLDRVPLIAGDLEIGDQIESVVLGGHVVGSTDARPGQALNPRSYHRLGEVSRNGGVSG